MSGPLDAIVGAIRDLAVENPYFTRLAYIDGIEVTQAIQYYKADKHLTDAADRGPDNSILLMMHKPALVRVYLRNLMAPAGTRFTGQLDVEGTFAPYETLVQKIPFNPIAPAFAPAVKPATYDAERGSIGASLNFIIPADIMSGYLKLTARIWVETTGDPKVPDDTHSTTVSAYVRQTLSLRGIMVGYNGPSSAAPGAPNLNLPAPTLADLTATASLAMSNMPVSSWPRISIGGNIGWSTPLTGMATSPGGCSQQWIDLNADVAEARDNDGNRAGVIYYGLLPGGIPVANVGGCESSGVASGRNGFNGTMAHEIGHACGISHAPCGGVGSSADPNYPAYEPYDPADTPTASLGEYGANVNNASLRPPASKDIMSYCGGDWFSLRNYQRLLFSSKLDPKLPYLSARIPPLVDPYDWPWDDPNPPDPMMFNPIDVLRPTPVISLIGVETRRNIFEVRSVTRVMAVSEVERALHTDYSLQLLDGGKVISEGPVFRFESCGSCGCKEGPGDRPPYLVRAAIADAGRGTELRLIRREDGGGEEGEGRERILWSRKAPEGDPRIEDVRAELKNEKITVRWSAKRSADPLRFSIQFSKDRGRSWNGVTTGITGSKFELDRSHLPAGSLIFRLLAHDGFNTVQADSNIVKNPPRPAIPVILHPQEASAISEGQAMRLWGVTVAGEPRDSADPAAFRWRIDGKDAGKGNDLWIAAPAAGKHRCELIFKERGGTSSAIVTFETVGPSRRRR